MKPAVLLIIAQLFCLNALCAGQRAELDLSGEWHVKLDRDKIGEEGHWWHGDFEESLHLPGSLAAQGFGDDVDINTPWVATTRDELYADPRYDPYKLPANFKFPFWLQPEKYYRGNAWYQREVEIPEDWKDKRVVLYLERAHWETAVWVNNKKIGLRDSLSAPHIYDLSGLIAPGKQKLTIRVDNSINLNVGVNSHSISDHTQGNWNGIVGGMKLYSTDLVWIEDVQVYPDPDNKQARVRVVLGNATDAAVSGELELRAGNGKFSRTTIQFTGEAHEQEFILPVGMDPRLWDEFSPDLYDLNVRFSSDPGIEDAHKLRFGIRKVATNGTQITINDRPVFLRGTLECAIFPKTGHPPTGVEAWRKIIQTCKDYGLNHMRFHSWCPPEAAFVAADELGFYFQVECASWANQGVTIGDGKPIDDWLYAEGRRITKAYGNHPSFVMMAYGNEPGGKNRDAYLAQWCTYWKEKEPRMLHTTGAGWPLLEESDFHNTHRNTRIQAWGAGLMSIINAEAPQTRFDFNEFLTEHPDKPTISHEIGQWCVYPNFSEIQKYTGLLKPRNFEIFRDFLEAAQMGDQANDFLMASGKLQALCYKHDIEAALRTRGFGGFQLLDLHDFPGQGTALVGILDPFWDEKAYINAEEHRRYCSPTVPLARMEKMVWTNEETFRADVEIAHFGPSGIVAASVSWSLKTPCNKVIDSGEFRAVPIPTGKNTILGKIEAALGDVTEATKVILEISVPEAGAKNAWDIWCYPENNNPTKPASVYVATAMDDKTGKILNQGGKVLLLIPPGQVQTDVELGFSSIFWNTAWTQGQAPHTLGVLCDPEHPALRGFPTDYHSNWQWWDLVTTAATIEMDALPPSLRPIVQIVPDWFKPQRLGLLFEARIGSGSLLVTSFDLMSDLDCRPVARQMLSSLYAYVSSPEFQPGEDISIEQVRSLVK